MTAESAKPRAHIDMYGESGTGTDITHRVHIVIEYGGRETRLAIELKAPLPEGSAGEEALREEMRTLAQAIAEAADSPQFALRPNRPRT